MSECFDIKGASYALVQCTCAVWFLIPKVLNDRALNNRGSAGHKIYCPNGHSWHYVGETEADKLRRERDRLKQDAARLEEEKAEAWATANATLTRAQKAEKETARIKKRALAAVCPCCNRSFSQLDRHMKTKHPEVTPLKVVAKVRG